MADRIDLLKKTPLAVLACYTTPKLITIPEGANVGKALQILRDSNVYAAPVVTGENLPVGMVDLSDITRWLATVLKGSGWNDERKNHLRSHHNREATEFFSKPVKEVINLSGQNKLDAMNVDDESLFGAITRLASGTRRLPLVEDSEVLTVVSPSLFVRYLSENIGTPEFADVLKLTVGERPRKEVVSIEGTAMVAEALLLMSSKGVSSLAIVDASGKLYSTFTLKDLRVVTNARSFLKLFKTVDEYILDVRRRTANAIFPAIHCYTKDTLERVLLRMAAARIHRMFVLNDQHELVDVISLRDMVTEFIK